MLKQERQIHEFGLWNRFGLYSLDLLIMRLNIDACDMTCRGLYILIVLWKMLRTSKTRSLVVHESSTSLIE